VGELSFIKDLAETLGILLASQVPVKEQRKENEMCTTNNFLGRRKGLITGISHNKKAVKLHTKIKTQRIDFLHKLFFWL